MRDTSENNVAPPTSDDLPEHPEPEVKRLTLESARDPSSEFELRLVEAGFSVEQVELAAEIFDAVFTHAAANQSIAIVREIFRIIADTDTGNTAEYRALLSILSPHRSIEDIAAEAGLSKQSVHYHVKKLRPLFDGITAYVEGNEAQNKAASK